MIVNPYIKDPVNIKWLEDNEETFLKYMAEHHAPYDLAHTFLHVDTLNDQYIEKMRQKIQAYEDRLEKEEKARKRKASGKKVSTDKNATAVEKKMAIMEEAAEAMEKKGRGDDLLLD